MRHGGKFRRAASRATVVAAATTACLAAAPAARSLAVQASPNSVLACKTVPAGTTLATGTPSRLDLPPVSGNLSDVIARSSSSALAIGSFAPRPPQSPVLVAQWNGKTWTTLSDRSLPRESALASGALYSGGAWVVGESGLTDHGDGGGVGTPLILRITGTTMRRMTLPAITGSAAVEDVSASSPTDAWAVGFVNRGPLVMHWNGSSWKRAVLPAALASKILAVDSVGATSKSNAWAVIRFKTSSFARLMHWNGKQWARVTMPSIGKNYGLDSVAATSATNVWTVGAGVIMHWNGQKWSCASISNTLFGVSTISPNNAWAVGGVGGGATIVHWNGQAFTQERLNPAPDQAFSLTGVAAIPGGGRAWAVGSDEHDTLMLNWDGTAWS